MRLRYLKITDLPPLEDIEVHFQHETLLGRECAIRFVVGVNGSGKSRLLRALTEVFVQLERASELDLPFPITLAYDVGRDETAHSVYIHYPGKREGSRFVVLDEVLSDGTDWANLDFEQLSVEQDYQDGDLPGTSAVIANIPKALIAYTSGNPVLWQAIFDMPPRDLDVVLDEEIEERPRGWSLQDERLYQASEAPELIPDEGETSAPAQLRSRAGYLVTTDNLKLAMLAVSLVETIDDLEKNPLPEDKDAFVERIKDAKLNNETMGGLRGLLNEVDWLWPISIGLEIDLDPDSLVLRRNRLQLQKLYQVATSVVKQPEPSLNRLLLFDLQRSTSGEDMAEVNINTTTARSLAEALSSDNDYKAFDIYRNLHHLHQQGILKRVQIAVQKSNLVDVLMYDWLSDGEQEFLGRMALFHLLKDQDDALVILDEPETHFNDVWKRRIVDIIDDSLRDNASEVVISTHSSIALTDVFETEITLLRKDSVDGTIAVIRQPAIKTFGASPNEIMRHIFNAPDTVGQRATEFLDMLLMVIAKPEDAEAIWRMKDEGSIALQHLLDYVSKLPHNYGDEEQIRQRLLSLLGAIRSFTQEATGQTEVSVVAAVEALRQRIGPGYYEFEFSRRLRALQQR